MEETLYYQRWQEINHIILRTLGDNPNVYWLFPSFEGDKISLDEYLQDLNEYYLYKIKREDNPDYEHIAEKAPMINKYFKIQLV